MHNKQQTDSADEIRRVSVITLGCSKNVVDSETLMGGIKHHQIELVDDVEDADALIINTCGFIDKAKEESINAILDAGKLRTEGKIKKLIVAGCLSDRYGGELKADIPEIDHVFGTMAFGEIIKTLRPSLKYDLLGERVLTTPSHYAYLKISEGCDNPCSFCAIPLMRGGHKSRPAEEIVRELRYLVSQGVKEIVVVAQDLTYYGLDLNGQRSLADLLKRMSDVDGVEWIRLMYAYPSKFPRDILPVMAERSNICKYLDMPLQHISTDVLKSMRRGITRNTTERVIAEIRDAVPDIALRTTLICGYPAEKQEHFEELCEWVAATRFDRLGVFEYSQEDNTVAHILGDPIAEEEKQRRCAAIMDIQREISMEKNDLLVGKQVKVLIDEPLDVEYRGRTEFDAPEVDNEVFVRSEHKLKAGDFVTVEIDDAAEYDLFAHVVGDD